MVVAAADCNMDMLGGSGRAEPDPQQCQNTVGSRSWSNASRLRPLAPSLIEYKNSREYPRLLHLLDTQPLLSLRLLMEMNA